MSRGQKLLLGLSVLSSLVIVAHTLIAPEGWRRRTEVRRSLASAETDLQRLETRATEMTAQISALREREAVQERVVRDELGYVRPGDVVLHVKP